MANMKSNKSAPKLEIVDESKNKTLAFLNSSGFNSTFKAIQLIAEIQGNIGKVLEPITKVKDSRPLFGTQEARMIYMPPRPLSYWEVRNIVRDSLKETLKNRGATSEEIIFTKDKELVRMIAGREIRYSFVGTGKRLVVFEALNGARDYIKTKSLRKLVESPNEQALRKTVQSINRETNMKLKMKMNLIESHRGFGYRINKNISIISE